MRQLRDLEEAIEQRIPGCYEVSAFETERAALRVVIEGEAKAGYKRRDRSDYRAVIQTSNGSESVQVFMGNNVGRDPIEGGSTLQETITDVIHEHVAGVSSRVLSAV